MTLWQLHNSNYQTPHDMQNYLDIINIQTPHETSSLYEYSNFINIANTGNHDLIIDALRADFINKYVVIDGVDALYTVISRGDYHTLRLLLSYKFDPNRSLCNEFSKSPYCMRPIFALSQLKNNHNLIIDLLLQHGADLNLSNFVCTVCQGNSCACNKKSLRTLLPTDYVKSRMLNQRNQSKEKQDQPMDTMTYALQANNFEIPNWLIAHGYNYKNPHLASYFRGEKDGFFSQLTYLKYWLYCVDEDYFYEVLSSGGYFRENVKSRGETALLSSYQGGHGNQNGHSSQVNIVNIPDIYNKQTKRYHGLRTAKLLVSAHNNDKNSLLHVDHISRDIFRLILKEYKTALNNTEFGAIDQQITIRDFYNKQTKRYHGLRTGKLLVSAHYNDENSLLHIDYISRDMFRLILKEYETALLDLGLRSD